ncbi:MAG: hypothetical protein K6E70_12025 [Butyrivibrio sp.]|nr:hypothetical protein [Butyrivibrio sp.]
MKSYEKIIRATIYLAFLLLLIIFFSKKYNVNVDEVYSYGLANHYGGRKMSFENGVKFVPANTPWIEYVAVSDEHRFDYGNVWSNQASDVHPPFYYVILHTICSFFPGRFSMWFGGAINIAFCLLSLLVFEKIVGIYTKDFWIKSVLCAAYALSSAFLNMSMFIRMYSMAMFCIMLFTYFYIRYFRCENEKWILIFIAMGAVFGTLTHYYCMIFIALLSVLFGIYCLLTKKYARIIKYAISMALAAGLCVVIFPGILGHFFNSDRGEQTISNAGSDAVLRTNFGKDTTIVLSEIFGKPVLFGAGLSAVIILLVLGFAKSKNQLNVEFVLIWLAIGGYMVFVSATAPYTTDRYFFPIYGVVFVVTLIPAANVLINVVKGKVPVIVMTAALLMVLGVSWHNVDWQYTDNFTRESVEWAKEHSNLDAVMIHGPKYRMHTAFLEVSEYASVTLANYKDLSKLPDPSEFENKDFVFIDTVKGEDDDYLEEVMKRYPGHSYSKVGYSAYHTTYYFTCSE